MNGRGPDIARLGERRNVVLEHAADLPRLQVEGGDAYPRAKRRGPVYDLDRRAIAFAQRAYPTVARGALFIVFFWFGFIKLLGVSEAAGLAMALTAKTVGLAHFKALFDGMAVFECFIGVLCLIPKAVRLLVVLLFVHLAVVCAPLVIVPERTWQTVLVPTMDGQYIIKNVLIIAAAVGLAANAPPRGMSRIARVE